MKKILASILALSILAVLLAGCAGSAPATPADDTISTITVGTTAQIEFAVRGEYNYLYFPDFRQDQEFRQIRCSHRKHLRLSM